MRLEKRGENETAAQQLATEAMQAKFSELSYKFNVMSTMTTSSSVLVLE
jgi:hypothetical protein